MGCGAQIIRKAVQGVFVAAAQGEAVARFGKPAGKGAADASCCSENEDGGAHAASCSFVKPCHAKAPYGPVLLT
jgi:hypothetical protein